MAMQARSDEIQVAAVIPRPILPQCEIRDACNLQKNGIRSIFDC
jgi:hypothetical protein